MRGHIIIERNGKACTCGKNGCYEAYASMRVLKANIRKYFKNETLSSEDIVELLKNKENLNQVENIIKEYIEYLAIGISNMARLCSADTVVIGGSFVHYKDLLFERLQNELDRIMSPLEKEKTTIKLAKFSNDAGIIGATLIQEI